jgi:hypothetical protein
MSDEKVDASFSKFKTELVLWLVGTIGLGVPVNHFWQ